mmetsp:Transcript_1167/g.2700  ORF Transcript_1167/g.2700 Transcript_1167/m.2700 type:complete len:200 (+) Transcript_1167:1804-2403(+)
MMTNNILRRRPGRILLKMTMSRQTTTKTTWSTVDGAAAVRIVSRSVRSVAGNRLLTLPRRMPAPWVHRTTIMFGLSLMTLVIGLIAIALLALPAVPDRWTMPMSRWASALAKEPLLVVSLRFKRRRKKKRKKTRSRPSMEEPHRILHRSMIRWTYRLPLAVSTHLEVVGERKQASEITQSDLESGYAKKKTNARIHRNE